MKLSFKERLLLLFLACIIGFLGVYLAKEVLIVPFIFKNWLGIMMFALAYTFFGMIYGSENRG